MVGAVENMAVKAKMPKHIIAEGHNFVAAWRWRKKNKQKKEILIIFSRRERLWEKELGKREEREGKHSF